MIDILTLVVVARGLWLFTSLLNVVAMSFITYEAYLDWLIAKASNGSALLRRRIARNVAINEGILLYCQILWLLAATIAWFAPVNQRSDSKTVLTVLVLAFASLVLTLWSVIRWRQRRELYGMIRDDMDKEV